MQAYTEGLDLEDTLASTFRLRDENILLKGE